MPGNRRLPLWLKMQRASGENYTMVKRLVEENRLHTICTSGNCPNIGECWNAGTATLMILGDICTRSCKFCGTASGHPLPPDPDEPERVASAVKTMGLKHCVVTSVDRDDLPDGGAHHWAETIRRIKEDCNKVTIETLIPDFRGDFSTVDLVIDAGPDVISHNIETVKRLTPLIRSVAKYDVSLSVLRHISSRGMVAKSGLMLGLGETREEVMESLHDLHAAGCSVVTLGQYLAPSLNHMPVAEYITPEVFEEYRLRALEIGFRFVESSPLVRSSFHAEKHVAINVISCQLSVIGYLYMMNSYKELEIYEEAFRLAKAVHSMSLGLPKTEQYELGSQIRRSAQSVRSNIVEGYGRREYKAEFIRFLIFADASLLETESHLEMIKELYENTAVDELLEEYHSLGKKVSSFINYVETSWKTSRDK